MPGGALPVAAAKPLAIEEKANAIIIPKLVLKEASLQESVDFLVEKSRELDPEKKGITITLPKDLSTLDVGSGPFPSKARLTVSLTNIPVFEALKYITSLAGVVFKVTESALVIVPPTPEAALRP